MADDEPLRPDCPRGHGDSMFATKTGGWRCAVCLTTKENQMQTYIFTVAITGEDVQDVAAGLREKFIENWKVDDAMVEFDLHVTEPVRVAP